MDSSKKELYAAFCGTTYVPIYSKPWWMDAVCGPESWDVWLYEQGGEAVAAMPYYLEEREAGTYITKAPLTQNNGIVFKHPVGAGPIARAKFEEKVVDAACAHIESLGLAVYEQQYCPSFCNWLPFSWHGYTAFPRYTFVIKDTSDLEAIWSNLSTKQRGIVKKGQNSVSSLVELDPRRFYAEHEKIFLKQGMSCPFGFDFWERLERACKKNGAGRTFGVLDDESNVTSLLFLVWDERSAYHLLGGGIPEFQSKDTYAALTWEGIKLAHEKSLAYDFEGSMIKRIAKSFREYGGEPKLYFRIRKVFDPEVVLAEACARKRVLEKEISQCSLGI